MYIDEKIFLACLRLYFFTYKSFKFNLYPKFICQNPVDI